MKEALKGVAKNTNHRFNDLFGKNPDVKYPDAFYFRVTRDWSMYYTSSKEDTVVLGVMVPEKIQQRYLSMACFEIEDKSSEQWALCGFEDVCPAPWKIAISEFLGQTFDGCDSSYHNELQKKIYIQPMYVQAESAEDCKYDFDYEKRGHNWHCNCNEGFEQSPIKLPGSNGLFQVK